MKSKSDLVTATEAARFLLRQIHMLQNHFAQVENPHAPGSFRTGVYFDPLSSIIFFIDAHRAARAMQRAFTEALRWELAALSSPRGIRVGVGVFPSVHEVAAEAARIVETNTSFLLISDAFFTKVDKSFSWEKGLQSLPEDLQAEYADYWRGEGHAGFFTDLLWELTSSLRPLRVLQLRGILDCEFALAQRSRPSQAQAEHPKQPAPGVSAITGRTPGPLGADDYRILQALAASDGGTLRKRLLVAQLAGRGVGLRTLERRLRVMSMEPLLLVAQARRGVWQVTPKGRQEMRRLDTA